MVFNSRSQAGILLRRELQKRGVIADMVFGLARGGVIVAAEVARALNAPLAPLVVRKIGAPGNEEFALGAVAEVPGTDRTVVYWDERALSMVHVSGEWKEQKAREKEIEIEKYKKELQFSSHFNRSNRFSHLLLVDDGAATGTSMLAAVSAVRQAFSHSVITIALPVASVNAAEEFRTVANDVVILHEDPELSAVGQFYKDFPQVEWEGVRELLNHTSFRAVRLSRAHCRGT